MNECLAYETRRSHIPSPGGKVPPKGAEEEFGR